jgi:predicted phosphodiesterase
LCLPRPAGSRARRALDRLDARAHGRALEGAAGADCDLLAFGHTHKPWINEYGSTLFVNCGSVGKPKDGDPRGGFGVLEADGERVRAWIERFDYDAEFAAAQVAESGLPAEYADKLLKAA